MKTSVASLLCGILLAPLAASASNAFFMYNMPVSYFTTQDSELFVHAVNQALDHNANGKTLHWNNPKTGAHGTVTPLHTTTEKGMRCREAQIFNEAQTVKSQSIYKFCRLDNAWKVVK